MGSDSRLPSGSILVRIEDNGKGFCGEVRKILQEETATGKPGNPARLPRTSPRSVRFRQALPWRDSRGGYLYMIRYRSASVGLQAEAEFTGQIINGSNFFYGRVWDVGHRHCQFA